MQVEICSRHVALLWCAVCLRCQDPEASYDVNDDDSDPQPRYEYTNENRSEGFLLHFTIVW